MVASSIANGLNPLSIPLTLFIVQLLLIVVISRVLCYLLSYIKQPPVISEVITGILLGPSVLGISSAFANNVFPASSMTVLNVFANVGLIFFMFMIGLEVDAGVLKNNLKASMIISLTSIIIPFAMGIGLAAALYDQLIVNKDGFEFGLFSVFVGVAVSITAFPVLARILSERNLMTTRVGVTALAAASVDDVIAWILLAFVVSYAKSLDSSKNGGEKGDNLSALWTFLMLLGFCIFMGLVVKIGLERFYKRFIKKEKHKHNLMIVLLMMMFMAAFYTEVIGVHAIFGAFILGICVPRNDGFHLYITERIEDIVTIVLLPLYFTFSGLRTKLNSINSAAAGGLTILIIAVACIGKIGGATLASRFTKKTWRESFTVGILMNTKGLVELIVLNIGLDIKVLDQQLFTMFVVMALVTTFVTTPTVHFVWTRWEDRQTRLPMVPRKNGAFNMLIYATQTRVSTAMTCIAGAITSSTSATKKYKVKAVFSQESSDRPSSYFFNNVKRLPQLRKEVYDSVESEARNIGIKIKPIIMSSLEDVSTDILTCCKNSWPDLVLLGWTRERFDPPLSNSMDHSGTEATFYGKTVSKVLQNIKSCVGIVVDKGLDRFHKQHNILFPYSGQPHENDAITLVLKMARRQNIRVTLLTNTKQVVIEKIQANPKLDINRFYVFESADPHQDALEKSMIEENDYWLVVLGVSREEAVKQERLVNSSVFSILMVHPSNTLLEVVSLGNGKTKSSQINLQELLGNDHLIEMEQPNNDNNNNNNNFQDDAIIYTENDGVDDHHTVGN
eukprot:gene2111-2600_t